MIPRAIAKQKTVNIKGLSVTGHVCIQETLLIPETTQQPRRIVWTKPLHADSVPWAEFR